MNKIKHFLKFNDFTLNEIQDIFKRAAWNTKLIENIGH